MSNLLCITNRTLCESDFFDQIHKIALAKPKAVMLREKDLTEEAYSTVASKVMEICKEQEVMCILHTFYDVALELNAEALHLPLPILKKLPERKKAAFRQLGTSCHSIEQVQEAQRLGCTYIVAGHIFATACKKDIEPRGLSFLKQVCEATNLPVYAIGGITPERDCDVRATGAAGACVMSSIMQCPNPTDYVQSFENFIR